jgi:Leucine-rich repeat (LRR) protein
MRMMSVFLMMMAVVMAQLAGVSPCPTSCSCQREYTDCRNSSLTSVPTNVTSNTTVIDISFNNISIVKNQDLVELPHLNIIFLNNNNILQLEPYIFHQTKHLLYLYLNNNKIVEINISLFQFSKKLRYLYLQNNGIRYIHPQLLEHNPDLVMLDISGNNIHKLEPHTFESNPILSWVNIRGNPLTLPLEWKTLFSDCFNVLDTEICGSSSSSISAFQKIPSLKLVVIKHSTVLNLDEFTSLENVLGLNKNEIGYLKLKLFHRLNSLSYGSINTMKIGEDFNVVSMTEDTILCYCEYHGFWYWCNEKSQTTCQNITTKTEIYKLLQCDVRNYNVTSAPDTKRGIVTSDRGRNMRLFGTFHRPVNWKTIKNTLLYASVPICIIILVIGVKTVNFIRRRRYRSETTDPSIYLELNPSDHM